MDENDKKAERAKRFGGTATDWSPIGAVPAADAEKLKKRSIRSISRLLADRLEASQRGVRVSTVSSKAEWRALEEELLQDIKR